MLYFVSPNIIYSMHHNCQKVGIWTTSQPKRLQISGALPNAGCRSYAGKERYPVYSVLVGPGQYLKMLPGRKIAVELGIGRYRRSSDNEQRSI